MRRVKKLKKIESEVLCYFPQKLREEIIGVLIEKKVGEQRNVRLEEICLRAERSAILVGSTFEEIIRTPSKADVEYIVQSISKQSLYAYENEIANGFITLKGGHRVGLCGQAVCHNGYISSIKNISALNFRIVGHFSGGVKKIGHFLKLKDGRVGNILIVSPPRCGKTTLLRELTRCISDGLGFVPGKVSLLDERSEIAACSDGVPQNNVGIRTDVLDSCPKQQGIQILLRSMAPEVIVCDEIGNDGDAAALLSAVNSGVKVIVSAHGDSIYDLNRRRETSKLIHSGLFDFVVVLDILHQAKVYDENGKLLFVEGC